MGFLTKQRALNFAYLCWIVAALLVILAIVVHWRRKPWQQSSNSIYFLGAAFFSAFIGLYYWIWATYTLSELQLARR
jgi:HAMP domain-containing protein